MRSDTRLGGTGERDPGAGGRLGDGGAQFCRDHPREISSSQASLACNLQPYIYTNSNADGDTYRDTHAHRHGHDHLYANVNAQAACHLHPPTSQADPATAHGNPPAACTNCHTHASSADGDFLAAVARSHFDQRHPNG
jgi:hypothetical protein